MLPEWRRAAGGAGPPAHPADAHPPRRRPRRYTRLSVIPLHDDNPMRRFPAVTRRSSPPTWPSSSSSSLPRWGITPTAGTTSRRAPVRAHPPRRPAAVRLVPLHGRRCSRPVRARRVAAPHLQRVVPVDLRQQRRGRDDATAVPSSTSSAGCWRRRAQVLVAPAGDVPLIGASGAIAGVLGGYLVLFPRQRVLTVIPLIVVWPVFEVPAWICSSSGSCCPGRRAGCSPAPRGERRRVSSPPRRLRRAAWRWCCCSPAAPARRRRAAGARRRV